ncbi:MAG: hypothetical protein COW67_11455 [Flavobacteriales bacterium CG18_big_fil_WC_8_21_14_2_50_32_9]|nr:DUF4293 domain-containing protein [Flavobacteriales bacterium]PIQ14869.1 MAG: hypothetical protein COW67_11455 [Flavobacteriales bacterium CG18_big_fil_WC_8_21_14_2_50_32_9]PJC62896.1 MAG: hypothetical protein CO022_02105 [Flavobacteriales bacterium CG_4_9_14_0_2_um_filter_32_27]
MIQRIQSLFLLLVALLGIVFSFTPIIELIDYENFFTMNAYYVFITEENSHEIVFKNMGVGVLAGIITLLATYIIFLYKNRGLQLKLSKLILLLLTLKLVAIFIYSEAATSRITTNEEHLLINYKIGIIIPILSLLFTYLAIHFIKKDDELVRSADRLR